MFCFIRIAVKVFVMKTYSFVTPAVQVCNLQVIGEVLVVDGAKNP